MDRVPAPLWGTGEGSQRKRGLLEAHHPHPPGEARRGARQPARPGNPPAADRIRAKKQGWSLTYSRDCLARVKTIYKWAKNEELIAAEAYDRLRDVQLRDGSFFKATTPLPPVEDTLVERTLPHLKAVVAAMVQAQRLVALVLRKWCRCVPRRSTGAERSGCTPPSTTRLSTARRAGTSTSGRKPRPSSPPGCSRPTSGCGAGARVDGTRPTATDVRCSGCGPARHPHVESRPAAKRWRYGHQSSIGCGGSGGGPGPQQQYRDAGPLRGTVTGKGGCSSEEVGLRITNYGQQGAPCVTGRLACFFLSHVSRLVARLERKNMSVHLRTILNETRINYTIATAHQTDKLNKFLAEAKLRDLTFPSKSVHPPTSHVMPVGISSME